MKKPILYDLVAWLFPKVIEYAHDDVAYSKGLHSGRVQLVHKIMDVVRGSPVLRSTKEGLNNGRTKYTVTVDA